MPAKAQPSQDSKVTQPVAKVKTRASSYVYLTPIPKEERTAFITIKNDAGVYDFDLQTWLSKSLEEKSFTVVDNIDKANLVLRANLFRVGRVSQNDATELLDSEFGNSTQILSPDAMPNNSQPMTNNQAVILDLQYFGRNDLLNPELINPRSSMNNLTDTQLLLLCNTARWERYQTRIIAVTFDNNMPQQDIYTSLGQAITTANTDIVRGLS